MTSQALMPPLPYYGSQAYAAVFLPFLLGKVALRSNDGEVLVMMERMCIAV